MPTLRVRAKPDTVARFERAARRRYAEATLLQPTEPLGAVYLFGYSCEIRLKAAYYRLARVPLKHDIELPIPPLPKGPRKMAEDRIKTLLAAYGGSSGSVGHHLHGWTLAIQDVRAASPVGPFSNPFSIELFNEVTQIWTIWAEFLRYCPLKPYNAEVEKVAASARWLKRHYRELWS